MIKEMKTFEVIVEERAAYCSRCEKVEMGALILVIEEKTKALVRAATVSCEPYYCRGCWEVTNEVASYGIEKLKDNQWRRTDSGLKFTRAKTKLIKLQKKYGRQVRMVGEDIDRNRITLPVRWLK